MAINDIVQTIAEARVDARSLSEFVFKPAGFKVARRLAPTVDTLQFYINRFNSLNSDFSSSVSVALSSLNNSVAEADGKVAYIETTVQDAINNAVISSGFVTIDSFELGATITQRNQALRHAADGKLYRWAGDLPKNVPVGSTPTSSGGISANAWLEVSDTALRQEIINGGLITDYLKMVRTYNNIAEVKAANNIRLGQVVKTLGYNKKGDAGGAVYTVIARTGKTSNAGSVHFTDNGLALESVGVVNKQMQWGIIDDNVTDWFARISEFHKYCADNKVDAIWSRTPEGTGEFRASIFRTWAGVKIVGNIQNPIKINVGLMAEGSSPNYVQQINGKVWVEGFHFNGIPEDFDGASVRTASDVTFNKCIFTNMKAPATMNGWGIYADDANRVVLIDCGFSGNSLNDVAIVDGCSHVEIIRPYSLDGTLNINMEPNYESINKYIKITGAALKNLTVQENSLGAITNSRIIVESCSVDEFYNDGGDVTLINTNINKFVGHDTSIAAGFLNILGCNLSFGANILSDTKFANVGHSPSNWRYGYIGTAMANYCDIYRKDGFRGVTLNPNGISTTVSIFADTAIPVEQGQDYLIALTGLAKKPVGSGHAGKHLAVSWLTDAQAASYNSSNTTDYAMFNSLTKTEVASLRTPFTTNMQPRTEHTIITPPVGKTHMLISLNSAGNASIVSATFNSISMHKVGRNHGSMHVVHKEHLPTSIVEINGIKGLPFAGDKSRLPRATGDYFYKDSVKYVCTQGADFGGDISSNYTQLFREKWAKESLVDAISPLPTSGDTTARPTTTTHPSIYLGYAYFDTALNKPVYFKSTGVWVDSLGATV